MSSRNSPSCRVIPYFIFLGALALAGGAALGQRTRFEVLLIAASCSLSGDANSPKEKAGVETLQRFVKEKTGLDNEVVNVKDWRKIADMLENRELHVAVFQGYEFSWAQERHPDLKALAVAVTGERYPVAYVMVHKNNPAQDFAGLEGKSFSVPLMSHGFLRLFVERQSEANGKKAEAFFSSVIAADNVEDALDDVVDGKFEATVVDRAAVEAYHRLKPGRFKQLRILARSQQFPPMVVAYRRSVLDKSTLSRFHDGLLGAGRNEKGKMLLTLSRLTAFETPPIDLDNALARTRKEYPVEKPIAELGARKE